MIENYIILPVLIQLFTAIVLLFFWRKTISQRFISMAGSLVAMLCSVNLFRTVWSGGILTMQAANWDAPFGITFVADVFSSTLVMLTGIAGFAVSVFSGTGIGRARVLYGYFPILHFLFMGLNGAFLTGDIFNLYVWFEVVIIASFVLMTLGGRKAQIEGAVKYMALNLLASAMFLTGIGMLYGITGTLNMADLSIKVPQYGNQGLLNVTAIFFLLGFGIKSAVFPLYFWLPSSYHTPPSAISAVFGGFLTKLGVYALFRVFTLIFIPDDFTRTLLIIIAVLTLLTGAFGALIKRNLRRMFSYLIVCHIGYMIAGLGLFTEIAIAGAVFYLFHDIIVKTNLFLMTGLIRNIRGTVNIDRLGGLYADYPKLSLLMAVVLFSLIGIPPLSGFWPKIFLFEAGFESQDYILIGAIVAGSFFTLYIIARMWADVFWRNRPEGEQEREGDTFSQLSLLRRSLLVAPIALLAALSLYIGFGAENITVLAKHIAAEMMDTRPYVEAVLGR